MSLLAIDSLWIEDSPQYQKYFSKRNLSPINVNNQELTDTLLGYLKLDSAPRVKSAVKSVFKKYQIDKNV